MKEHNSCDEHTFIMSGRGYNRVAVCTECGYEEHIPESMIVDRVIQSALTLFPDAEIGEDNDGQIVIYTGIYH